ncbi:MAG: DUF3857 domain-containing protein [Flavobacterium sp.]|nr:DUF3857 domain-containing protein [Flavobacterium sp.]
MRIYFVLFLFLISILLNAQKFEPEKVTFEMLKASKNSIDTTAVAAILYRVGVVNFNYLGDKGFETVTTIKTRMKIYSKQGFDYANQKILYYVGNNIVEKIEIINAFTYNLKNGNIEKIKLKSDGIFDEKLNKYWGRKQIIFPNISEGSIIEFEYKLTSSDIVEFKNWKFQSEIPQHYSSFTTIVPEYYKYNTKLKGSIEPKIKYSDKNTSIYVNSGSAGGAVGYSFDCKMNVSEYQCENVPPIEAEVYINNIDNYTSGLYHELASTHVPGNFPKDYSTTWESVCKTIFENKDFGKELEERGFFENELKRRVLNAESELDILYKTFQFVKEKIKWNNTFGYLCDDGLKNAYANQKGNVAEVNLTLIAMLRYIGFDANPVLLSTRANGISIFPTRTSFNYVIAAVEFDGKTILLDATEKHAAFDAIPFRDLNSFGRLVKKDGTSEEINLMPTTFSSKNINLLYKIDEKGNVNGSIRTQLSEQFAFSFREQLTLISKEDYITSQENSYNNVEILDYKLENLDDLSKPIIENYNFKSNNEIEIIGNKIFFNPTLFFKNNQNPFYQETRDFPIDFGFPFSKRFIISIEIPGGYKIEHIPQQLNITTPNKLANFRFNISAADLKIQIVINYSINSAVIPEELYNEIKDFFSKMIIHENEKIVLKKL